MSAQALPFDAKRLDRLMDQAGMDVFNKVWTSPETLPTREEITHPQAWLDRVGGSASGGVNGSGAAAS